jgi:ATP synthase protein I
MNETPFSFEQSSKCNKICAAFLTGSGGAGSTRLISAGAKSVEKQVRWRVMSDGREKQTFEQRLAAAQGAAGLGQAKREQAASSAGSAHRAINLAMRLGVELVAAMAIAVAIGWGLDRLLHTRPWLMVAMVPVGMAAGLRNLVRSGGPASGGPVAKP